jgi:chemotaxis response regulator CheB
MRNARWPDNRAWVIDSGARLSPCKTSKYDRDNDWCVHLCETPRKLNRLPADVLFTSFAQDFGSDAIGVVLSGD